MSAVASHTFAGKMWQTRPERWCCPHCGNDSELDVDLEIVRALGDLASPLSRHLHNTTKIRTPPPKGVHGQSDCQKAWKRPFWHVFGLMPPPLGWWCFFALAQQGTPRHPRQIRPTPVSKVHQIKTVLDNQTGKPPLWHSIEGSKIRWKQNYLNEQVISPKKSNDMYRSSCNGP